MYPVYGMCSGMSRGMFGVGHAVRLLSGALTGTDACAGWRVSGALTGTDACAGWRLIRSEERANLHGVPCWRGVGEAFSGHLQAFQLPALSGVTGLRGPDQSIDGRFM